MPYSVLASGERLFYTYKAAGAATDVVFVHGAGGTHRIWGYQVQGLRGANRYALDLPAHGRSDGVGRDTIASYGQVVLQFLDALALEQVILVGHSMGGAIAQWLALHYPEPLVGLGLVGTGARLRVLPAILEGLETKFEETVDLIVDFAFGPAADEAMRSGGRKEWLANEPAVIRGDFVACDRFDVTRELHNIDLPATVVVGRQDRLTPLKYAKSLAEHLPHAELNVVEDAGHMAMVEQPDSVTHSLQRLIARCS